MPTRNSSRSPCPISLPGWVAASPISGGMSQSLVNEGGGARTPLSGAFAAGIILVVILFFSHLLAALPQPVLAAVVLVAVASLFNLKALKNSGTTIDPNSLSRWRPSSECSGKACSAAC